MAEVPVDIYFEEMRSIVAPYEQNQAVSGSLTGANMPLIVDVRKPKELAQGMVPGAINVPVKETKEVFTKATPPLNIAGLMWPLPRTQPIITYCFEGIRANQVRDELKSLGFTNVKSYAGWRDWSQQTQQQKQVSETQKQQQLSMQR